MNDQTPGQAACIAWNATYAEQHGIEARNEWAASDERGRAAWEAAAAAVETEQLRLAREQVQAEIQLRRQLVKRLLDLADQWDELADRCDAAAELPGLPKAAALQQATFGQQLHEDAAKIRKALDTTGVPADPVQEIRERARKARASWIDQAMTHERDAGRWPNEIEAAAMAAKARVYRSLSDELTEITGGA